MSAFPWFRAHRSTTIVVGPEGGWVAGEVDDVLLEWNAAEPSVGGGSEEDEHEPNSDLVVRRASLGGLILRTETACMFALANCASRNHLVVGGQA